MDLVLVMKERLRDQNIEIRSTVRHFLVMAAIGGALLICGLWLHSDSHHMRAFSPLPSELDGGRKTEDAPTSSSSSSNSGMALRVLSVVATIVGYLILANGIHRLDAIRLLLLSSSQQTSRSAAPNMWRTPPREPTPSLRSSNAPIVPSWYYPKVFVAMCAVAVIMMALNISLLYVCVWQLLNVVLYAKTAFELCQRG